MRRLFRIALLWLIALSMPVQGIAAASMAVCGPSHARMAQAVMTDAVHDHATHGHNHASHGDHAPMPHHHDDAVGASHDHDGVSSSRGPSR